MAAHIHAMPPHNTHQQQQHPRLESRVQLSCTMGRRPLRHRLLLVAGVIVTLAVASLPPPCAADIFVYTRDPPQLLIEEFRDMPAHFGPSLPDAGLQVLAVAGLSVNASAAIRVDGCEPMLPPPSQSPDGSVLAANGSLLFAVIVERGNCEFLVKVRNAQKAGFGAVIVYNLQSNNLEPMSAKDADGITIPSVFVGEQTGHMLLDNYQYMRDFVLILNGDLPFDINTRLILPFSVVVGLCFVIMSIFMVMRCVREGRRQRRNRLPRSALKRIPVVKFNKATMTYETCIICLDDYTDGEKLRVLPCNHAYHCKCIDEWLTKNRRVCPICKRVLRIRHSRRPANATTAQASQQQQQQQQQQQRRQQQQHRHYRSSDDSESDSDIDDSTPLLNPVEHSAASAAASNNHGTFASSASGSQRVNPFDRSPNLPPSLRSDFAGAAPHHSIYQRMVNFLLRRSSHMNTDADSERAALIVGAAGTVVAIAESVSQIPNDGQSRSSYQGADDNDDDDDSSNTLRTSNIYEPSSSSQQSRIGVVAIPNLEFCPLPAAPSSSAAGEPNAKPPNDFVV